MNKLITLITDASDRACYLCEFRDPNSQYYHFGTKTCEDCYYDDNKENFKLDIMLVEKIEKNMNN